MLWVGSISLGLGTASVFPTLLILAGERLKVTGTITGLFLLGSGAGSMLLPWLIGNAFTSTGPAALINIIIIDTALALLAVIAFIYSSRGGTRSVPIAGPVP
jgi:fucose permease